MGFQLSQDYVRFVFTFFSKKWDYLTILHNYFSVFSIFFVSRFRPISVFREADEDESGFMCCAFSARERFLMLGTCTGQLKLYNVFTGQEEASYSCHSSAITHLEPSRVSRESYQYTSNFRLYLVFVAAVSKLFNTSSKIFKIVI